MIETADEFIRRMKDELNKLNSWYIPISVDGKYISDVELVERDGNIEMKIKTE